MVIFFIIIFFFEIVVCIALDYHAFCENVDRRVNLQIYQKFLKATIDTDKKDDEDEVVAVAVNNVKKKKTKSDVVVEEKKIENNTVTNEEILNIFNLQQQRFLSKLKYDGVYANPIYNIQCPEQETQVVSYDENLKICVVTSLSMGICLIYIFFF